MPRDMYAWAMSGSTKFVKGVSGLVARSCMLRRRSSRGSCGFEAVFSGSFAAGVGSGFSGGLAAAGSAGLISFLNSSRISPSGVKIRLSVTFSSFGAGLSFGNTASTRSARFERCRVKSRVCDLITQGPVEKRIDPAPRVLRRRLVVALLVVRIHERVAGAVVDLHVAQFSVLGERRAERLHVVGRDPAVFRAEVAENLSLD